MTLFWDPELAPGWPSQVCLCLLIRPRCVCGDLGDLPPWPWCSMLGEGGFCLDEWEAGFEQRLGMGFPSCVVTEIWGSERPAGRRQSKATVSTFHFPNNCYRE